MLISLSGVSILQEKGHHELVHRKKKSTVHQVSTEPSTTTVAAYTNEDGTVTYTHTHNISMVSTVSLIKPQVIDNDDNATPEDILISVPKGNEQQSRKS